MKIHFFCIRHQGDTEISDLLKQACIAQDVTYVDIDIDTFDVTADLPLGDLNLLYRVGGGYHARQIQLQLMKWHDFTTFYATPEDVFFRPQVIPFQDRANIPAPRTVTYAPRNRELLMKYVDYVGGFPVILKATGLSHGAGVMKIDSTSSLYSVLDFIDSTGTQEIIIREYIESREHARLVVLGDKVVDSIVYNAQGDDFRTNVGKPHVEPRVFSEKFQEIAVHAVKSMRMEFGGVDVLIGQDGSPYVAEVNIPCYFPRCQKTTGTDIASMMIAHLVSKAKK